MRIGRGEFTRFQVTPPKILVPETVRRTRFKQMKSEPPSIHSRDPLRLAKERHEKQQNQIGIDHTLQFEVTRKILAIDPAQARLKLQRGVERVINLFHKHYQRLNIAVR